MSTHLRVLSESYPMNTTKTGFRYFFQKSLHPCALDESSLSIGWVNNGPFTIYPRYGIKSDDRLNSQLHSPQQSPLFVTLTWSMVYLRPRSTIHQADWSLLVWVQDLPMNHLLSLFPSTAFPGAST